MRISEYIELMKKSRPEVLDPKNIYQQFYQVNEKVLDLLLQTKKINMEQYNRLWLVNESIMGEIVISWLGKDYELVLRNVDANQVIYYKVAMAIEPKSRTKCYLIGTDSRV